MSRQWMYNADRSSVEFIDGVHEFIEAANKHKYCGFVRCPCKFCQNEKDYSSSRTIHNHCSIVVSCPTTIFGPSMEKEGLCWIIMKKKRTRFLTLRPITVPFFKILQWVSLKRTLHNIVVPRLQIRSQKVGYHIGIIAMECIK